MSRKGGAPENLEPVRTKEEAKKRGKNGGIKSGESRRRKRDAKSAAKMILDLPCSDDIQTILENMHVTEEDFTNRVATIARLFNIGMKGNVTAIRTLVELAGELPSQQLEEKRYNSEQKSTSKGSDAVDDWIDAVLEADELEKNNVT